MFWEIDKRDDVEDKSFQIFPIDREKLRVRLVKFEGKWQER
jgi:hypothetical protein